MKHLNKRLMAGIMAAVMLLGSSTMTAFASESSQIAGGSFSGDTTYTGVMPPDVFRVVVPAATRNNTLSDDTESAPGIFQMILDPHDMIKRTKAFGTERAIYKGVDFGAGKLFFQNLHYDDNGDPVPKKDEDGNIVYMTDSNGDQILDANSNPIPVQEFSYSRRSDDVTIYNKGSTAVYVNLRVEMENWDLFEFAYTPDLRDRNGLEIDGPAMYLALQSGKRRAPVLNTLIEPELDEDGNPIDENGEIIQDYEDEYENVAKMKGWIANPNTYEMRWNAVDGYHYQLKSKYADESNLPEGFSYPSMDFHLIGVINGSDKWDGLAEGGEALLNVIWEVTTEKGPEEDPRLPVDPSVMVTTAAEKAGDNVTMSIGYGEGANAMTKVQKMLYTKTNGTDASIALATSNLRLFNNKKLVLNASSLVFNASNWRVVFSNDDGTLTKEIPVNIMEVTPDLEIEEEEAPSTDPVWEVTKKAEFVGDTATISITDWGSGYAAMSKVARLEYKNSAGEDVSLSLDGSEDFSFAENVVTVKMVQELYSGSAWTLVLTTQDERTTFDAAVDLKAALPDNPDNPDNPDTPYDPETGEEPYVMTVTAASAAGGIAKLTVDWGTEGKAMTKVVRVLYTNANGEEKTLPLGSNLKVSGATVTLRVAAAVFNGSNWRLQLANDSGATFEAPFDPKKLGRVGEGGETEEDAGPTVTVTAKASAMDDTVSATLNWGSGSKAMTNVVKLAYANASGSPAEEAVGSANLSVSGTSVTVKAVRTIYAGSDWRLVLSNNISGETLELPFDLKAANAAPVPEETLSGEEPYVTTATAASAAGGIAKLTVDWGTETRAMTKVVQLLYTNASGAEATVPLGTNLKVSGATVTLRVAAAVFNGSNWRLQLANDSGATFEALFDPKNVGRVES